MIRASSLALLVTFAACGAPPSPHAEPVAVVPSAAPPSLDASDAAASLDAGDVADAHSVPREVHVHFSLSPRDAAGERELSLKSGDGAIYEKLATIAATHRCEMTGRPDDFRRQFKRERTALHIGCGVDLTASVAVAEGDGSIGVRVASGQKSVAVGAATRDIPVPPGVTVIVDPFADAPGAACTPGATSVPVVVERETKLDDSGTRVRSVAVRVPTLGIDRDVAPYDGIYCHGGPRLLQNSFVVDCSLGTSDEKAFIHVRDGAVFVDTASHGAKRSVGDALGGVDLPCGAKVDLPRVEIVSPTWSPLGTSRDCVLVLDRCNAPCFEKFTKADGNVNEEGETCEDRCDARFPQCSSWHGTRAKRRKEPRMQIDFLP